MGLYVVKKYLDAIGGSITVDTQLGQGSCFTIHMPFRTKFTTPNHHILIVEDNPLAARTAQHILKKLGCSSKIVETSAAAIDALTEERYDLILVDIGLPDRSGLTLAEEIRSSQQTKTIPIIALTGHFSAEKKEACLAAGIREMITKPMSLAVAESLLRQFIRSKPLG